MVRRTSVLAALAICFSWFSSQYASAAVVWLNMSPATCGVSALSTSTLTSISDGSGVAFNGYNGAGMVLTCAISIPQNATIDFMRVWGRNNSGSTIGTVTLNRHYYLNEGASSIASISIPTNQTTWTSFTAASFTHVADPSNYSYFITLAFPIGGALTVGHIELRYNTP